MIIKKQLLKNIRTNLIMNKIVQKILMPKSMFYEIFIHYVYEFCLSTLFL